MVSRIRPQIPAGPGAALPTPAGALPRTRKSKELLLWRGLLREPAGVVLVLPSPHGDNKYGISARDAWAGCEIYARLRHLTTLEIRPAPQLGDDVGKNLVVIAGNKANAIARNFQAATQREIIFQLDDGAIFDRESQVIVTAEYGKAGTTSAEDVTDDFGLIVYAANPFGRNTKLVQVAGIKGIGTLAAAMAISDDSYIAKINKLITHSTKAKDDAALENMTIEILVKADAVGGKIKRESISIEKINVADRKKRWRWESEAYRRLAKVAPHRLSICSGAPSGAGLARIKLDDQEITFAKSPDRLKMIQLLAERAKQDYLNQADNGGWTSAAQLAEQLWQLRRRGSVVEIPHEIRRETSGAILAWARHLQKQGKLKVDEDIRLDQDYVNSEILVFDVDVKKKIVDLVHMINQEERHRNGADFQLIECHPGLGYRIKIHPALIFINAAAG